jgi:hypothetical protein
MAEKVSTAEGRAGNLETARDQARADAAEAREEAARLRGQNEAMQSHQAELMHAITARDGTADR